MTRQRKLGWLLTAGALATAVLALSALATPTIRLVDARYVKQSGYIQTRTVDSLTLLRKLDAIDGKLARVDSTGRCTLAKLDKRPSPYCP